MRLSKKAKLLFLHIPRNAGKSVIQAMRKKYPDTRKIAWEHARMKDIKYRKYWNYRVIAVARNPWERLVSMWCFLRQSKKTFEDRRHKTRKTKNFPDFSDWLLNYGKTSHGLKVSDIPQVNWLLGYGEFYQYEKLHEIEKVVGKLPITHETKRLQPYQKYYTDKAKDWVAKKFRKDIVVFNYEF